VMVSLRGARDGVQMQSVLSRSAMLGRDVASIRLSVRLCVTSLYHAGLQTSLECVKTEIFDQ